LEAAEYSPAGQLIRRALNLRAIIKIGIPLTLDDFDADELHAVMIIEDESNSFEREKERNGR
jgi:hypothetical protein